MELENANHQMTPTNHERDLRLQEDGGIYAWRDLFRFLRAEWSDQLFPYLEIPNVLDRPALNTILERFLHHVDTIEARLSGQQTEDGFAEFHAASELALRDALDEIEEVIGVPFARSVHRYGVLRSTANEWTWYMLLRRLSSAEAANEGSAARTLKVASASAKDLLRLVRTHLERISDDDVEGLDREDRSDWQAVYYRHKRASERESVVTMAADLLRWATTRALLRRFQTTLSPTTVQKLCLWAQAEATQLGIDEKMVITRP